MRSWFVLACLLGACKSAPPPSGTGPDTVTWVAPPDECSDFDETTCDQQENCHPEFGWPLQCRGNHCESSTTFGFVACHAGATASCAKPAAACDEPDPACATQGSYSVNWVGGCHQGCVRAEDCAAN